MDGRARRYLQLRCEALLIGYTAVSAGRYASGGTINTVRRPSARMSSPPLTNILDEIAERGDLRWITQRRSFPHCHGEPPRASATIIADVLKSHRVVEVMADECRRRDWTKEAVEMEAKTIVEEMAHMSSLTVIRAVGYLLTKVRSVVIL